jgi:hypothetical protein
MITPTLARGKREQHEGIALFVEDNRALFFLIKIAIFVSDTQ